jgi:hypothetical protein
LLFVVRQHNPLNNKWYDVSHYNESGNFLGPAIFNTKQEAIEYLKQYESKMLARLTSIKASNKNENNQKQQQNQKRVEKLNGNKKKNYHKRRKPGRRPTTNEYIKLKVFQESTLPPVNKPPLYFHKSN